jgi:Na+-transporting NADH:ubiquinone oxidoreductase subunit C
MKSLFNKVLSLPNDDKGKTIIVAVALCLVCSILVSLAAVGLRSAQEANKEADKRINILKIGGLMEEGKSVDELFEKIETRLVDLDSGEYTDVIDATIYDAKKAAKDPATSKALSADLDIASIKRRAKYASVYLVKEGDQLKRVILPVHGYGLWSTLYGFLALEADMRTVAGFGFYQHAETPGLGGEVDNPKWKSFWPGKLVFDEQNKVAIKIIKGNVDPTQPGAEHKVDGLAGASLTSRGVQQLLHFWLGEQGYGKYLQKIRG